MRDALGYAGQQVVVTGAASGMGWRKNLEAVRALVETPDLDAGRAWCEAHPDEANGLVFLASRMARFVSGQTLFVDYAFEAQIDAGLRPALL